MWFFHYEIQTRTGVDHSNVDDVTHGNGVGDGNTKPKINRTHSEHRIFLEETARQKQYRKWHAVNRFSEMDGLHYYLQHPLFAVPHMDHWLWDGGDAISGANDALEENMKIWKDINAVKHTADAWMAQAASFLERPLTRTQLKAILRSVKECKQLNELNTGIFQRRPRFQWGDKKQGDEKQIDAFVNDIFEVFGEEMPMREFKSTISKLDGIDTTKRDERKRGGLAFVNKSKNLKKTTNAIEKDVYEMKVSLNVLIDEMKGLRQEIHKTYPELT